MHLIRCKGDKFRVDDGIGDTRHVASGDEMEKWWREHGKEILLAGSALCDGRRVYEHSFVRPGPWWKPSTDQVSQGDERAAAEGVRVSAGISNAAEYFVDLLAYPPRLDLQQLASSPLWTAHFDPKGENGPAGSVRVELQLRATRRRSQTTVACIIKKSSGCNPSTATPSSSTSLPTALRLMKTRGGRKSNNPRV